MNVYETMTPVTVIVFGTVVAESVDAAARIAADAAVESVVVMPVDDSVDASITDADPTDVEVTDSATGVQYVGRGFSAAVAP